jgi:hypothetical protein
MLVSRIASVMRMDEGLEIPELKLYRGPDAVFLGRCRVLLDYIEAMLKAALMIVGNIEGK